MVDPGAVYADGRRRVTKLLRATGDVEAAGRTPAPACPAWTVADVVAHLTGICADALAGNMDGVTTERWTEAQVAARRGTPLAAVLDEWSEVAPQVEARVSASGSGEQWLADFATHEQDVRGALSTPGARDSDVVGIAVGFMVPGFLGVVAGAGAPPLEVRAGGRGWRSHDAPDVDAPAATLTADPFEVLRSLTGRRSPEQVRALAWRGDPSPYLPLLAWGPFSPRTEPLIE